MKIQLDLRMDKVIDIYLTPRFWKGQLVYDGRRPLLIYQKPFDNNVHLDQTKPYPPQYTRKLESQDGMIYQISQMRNAKQQNGVGIKMLICVTMYNEPLQFLQRTLAGIYKNFQKLIIEKGYSSKDIAVVIIQDGILKLVTDLVQRRMSSSVSFFEKIDYLGGKSQCKLVSRINQILDEIDIYQTNNLGDFVKKNNGLPPSIAKNISLLYQFEWKPNRQLQQRYSMEKIQESQPSLQILACFKHLNAKKLASHLWFFQGFCRLFNPQFCTLMDIGTQPYPTGLINFIGALQNDHNLGGVSGFMTLDIHIKSSQSQLRKYKTQKKQQQEVDHCQCQKMCSPIPIISTISFVLRFVITSMFSYIGNSVVSFLLKFHNAFSIQRAQLYQYNYSHMLDKNFQSFFKYLNVLPGAWSAYRYQAISRGNRYQENLLQKKYLKMVLDPSYSQKDYKQANMYLAEDRILCLGIYCQKGAQFNLEYVPQAMAKTDPMDSLVDLMVQRRRWINSSYFAFDYVFKNYEFDVRQSNHNFFQKSIMLPIVIIFSKLSIVNTYLTPAVFLFSLFTSTHETFVRINPPDSYFRSQPLVIIPGLVCLGYILTIGSLIIMSLNKKASQATLFYEVTSAILGFYNLFFVCIVIAFILLNYVFTQNLTGESLATREYIKYLLIFNFACVFLPLLVHVFTHPKQLLQMVDPRTILSYLYYQAAYSHTFVIYAFCNVDDVTWGTKGSSGDKQQEMKNRAKQDTYYHNKLGFIGRWIVWNSIMCFVLIVINSIFVTQQNKAIILIGIGTYSTCNLAFRTLFAILHHIKIIFITILRQREIHYSESQNEKVQNNLKKRTFLSTKKAKIDPTKILPTNLFADDMVEDKYILPYSGRVLVQRQKEYQSVNPLSSSNLPARFPTNKNIGSKKQISTVINPFKSQRNI